MHNFRKNVWIHINKNMSNDENDYIDNNETL